MLLDLPEVNFNTKISTTGSLVTFDSNFQMIEQKGPTSIHLSHNGLELMPRYTGDIIEGLQAKYSSTIEDVLGDSATSGVEFLEHNDDCSDLMGKDDDGQE